VRVQYKYGMDKYSDQVTAIVSNYLQYVDIKHFTDHFSIEGYVNDQGFLANLESFDSFSQAISQGLIMSLKRLPPLEPATIDGKAVKQKVKFSFTFTEGLYKYNYGFGEIMEK
jgi:hypothetical protein